MCLISGHDSTWILFRKIHNSFRTSTLSSITALPWCSKVCRATHPGSCLEATTVLPCSEYKFNSDEEEEPETRYGMALTMDV